MKKTLILTAIIALTMTSAYAAENNSKSVADNNTTKFEKQLPPMKSGEFRGKNGGHRDMFAERLKLTDKQKEQIKKNREADREKMAPIMKKIHEKEMAKREIFKKYEQTDNDLIKLNKEIKELRTQQHKIMEENRKSFEKILTKEQKAELEKIKKEKPKNMHKGHRGQFIGPVPRPYAED